MSRKKAALLLFQTIFMLLLLAPILTSLVSTLNDTPDGLLVSVFTFPSRIQEGGNTTITVEVRQATSNQDFIFEINTTNPSGTFSGANLSVTADDTGFGSASMEFWKEFPEQANTDYVGEYFVSVKNLTTKETMATSSFAVGLTNRLGHARNETVMIRASGYEANENVTLNIKRREVLIAAYPNVTATPLGIVNFTWQIPVDAKPGVYTVSVANATDFGTVKNPPDIQEFYVEVWQAQIWARNLADEPVTDLTIKADNNTLVPPEFLNLSQSTNQTGWASFMLATGNYTFKVFWKQVEVGILLANIENDTVLVQEGWIQLTNLIIKVVDEATMEILPFIQLRLTYNYTSEAGEPLNETSNFRTNFTGTVYARNLFVNISYVVEAKRYGVQGLSLPQIQGRTTPLEWNTLTVKFPVYTAFIYVVDSKNNSVEGVTVEAHEWDGGSTQSKTTEFDGNVVLSLTFGRYRVKVSNGSILLMETMIDLTQDQASFLIHLVDYKIDFKVRVTDYFGQPIPNVMVKIERNAGTVYVETALPGFTEQDGHVTFSGILGGDSRISIYVGGQLSETRSLYLTNSTQVTFNLNRHIVIAGNVVKTSQFVTAIVLTLLVGSSFVVIIYKRLLATIVKRK